MHTPATDTLQSMRKEKDLLGELDVPKSAYYGIQTRRACHNFDLSGIPINHFPELVNALAYVKLACAKTNNQLGQLSDHKTQIIEAAANKVLQGYHHEDFVVDMIQGGAGTSTNMNANEVIANIGLELMGKEKGHYTHLHPNNDINKSQSTNDVYPTAVRLSIILLHSQLVEALTSLRDTFSNKALEFNDIIKMGRTQLQDAVPMTLGQEFQSFASTLNEDIQRIADLSQLLKEVNLGGTAIGTGINTHSDYAPLAVQELANLTGIDFILATDLIEASSDMGAFVLFSSMLKRLAVKLSKISNDLRLLSMGPRCGLAEIQLPAAQPGSSIMPGKINPVIPEAMNQVAYQVMGNDLAITFAAEAGQLQLNAMEPLIAYKVLESIRLLTKSMGMLETRCIQGITANKDRCQELVNNSIGIITAIAPTLGYETATRVAKQALATGRSVLDLVLDENLMDEKELKTCLQPKNMVKPQHREAQAS
ncbi:aspartate ammonia-lyase [Marinomonas sp. SBI22]|uniref:aspartate ammonia-lyase n=1 Tax=unclassified Marinomonas TaxID=196814 RepID=UPI0007AFDD42|nr:MULTISPECIES: aspartate ammonia-lyase [unclassified Marinomonas]KZM40650.1 aspartate ammonia-lyase [Marinomonas sp. SBI22]KZM42351.1 aspartate ammonia-lyase [Marinomonas sp. SBI8L]